MVTFGMSISEAVVENTEPQVWLHLWVTGVWGLAESVGLTERVIPTGGESTEEL